MYKQYRKRGVTEAEPWSTSTNMTRVSVSAEDRDNGSPKEGDMVARDPKNHDDQWLIASGYFQKHYEAVK